MDKELLLHKLITADGVETPIEEINSHPRSIIRALKYRRSVVSFDDVPDNAGFSTREYRLDKAIPCTLLVYVERG